MNEEEARHLADQIIATWPAGAKHYIWKQILIPLDHHTADVTYRIVRDGAQSTPTPGNYLLAYKSQLARLTATPQLFDAAENVISLAEYLERLNRHPVHGDHPTHWTHVRERMRVGDVIRTLKENS